MQKQVTFEDLITGAEVARRLGVSRQRVQQLAQTAGFPTAVGKVGQAVVWHAGDIERYAIGVRQLIVVNGIPLSIDRATGLAARLRRAAGPDTTKIEHRIAAALESRLDAGGGINVTGEDAVAVWSVLQKWLDDVSVDVFGKQLMALRDRMHGELDPARHAT